MKLKFRTLLDSVKIGIAGGKDIFRSSNFSFRLPKMASKLTSPMSKSPAYELWTMSLLAMLMPSVIGLMLGDSSEFDFPAQRLIYFCGFYILQIEETGLFDNLHQVLGYTLSEIVSIVIALGIIAMWFMILALPAFNRFSLKKRYRLHFLQVFYSTIQVVGGAIFAQKNF